MKHISKYEIIEEIGTGGMGVVYKAYDPHIERQVAIKIIAEKALEIPEVKLRFNREARTAGKLSHQNIAVVYDLGEIDGKTFIVMEYLPGRDLRNIIDDKEALPLQVKLEYARQICLGLQFAHSHNIVHRDIKPENIKVLDNGQVKIIDFGIAKPDTSIKSEAAEGRTTVLTQAGMRIGTPWYMSPEQVKGAAVDRRSDIFSFGVVLYELLTYKKPFEGDDTTVLYKILNEEPDPIRIGESGLFDELQTILSKCLEKKPDERYGDCAEVIRDLDDILGRVQQKDMAQDLYNSACHLADQRRYGEAILKFHEVLSIEPDHAEAQANIRKFSAKEKKTSRAKILTGKIAGDIISHFKVIEKLGGGGMGVVYKVEDTTLKRTVALKFLAPDLTRDDTAKKRFLAEAQAASALDHPNICTIHEIGETDDGLMFICMTYCEGQNLGERISQGDIGLLDCLDIVMKIAKGLERAHDHGIVHRDIKPRNIMVADGGDVKIVDFGLAKLSRGTRITKTGTPLGTLPYMSPEQVRGFELDHRSDIWSLGVLMYELLTGELPFQGDYEAAILYSILNEDHVPASSVNSEIPPELDEIIDRALKKSAGDRFASMQEMLDALDRFRLQFSKALYTDLASSTGQGKRVSTGSSRAGTGTTSTSTSRRGLLVFLLLAVPALVLLGWQILERVGGSAEFAGVTLQADADCKLVLNDSTVYDLKANTAFSAPLAEGAYKFEVMPRDYPIFSWDMQVDRKDAVEGSISKRIDVRSRHAGAAPITLVVNGYLGDFSNKIKSGLLVNGFERPLGSFHNLRIDLPRGSYEIKFDLPDEWLLEDELAFDAENVVRSSRFRFDFSEFPANEASSIISFTYARETP